MNISQQIKLLQDLQTSLNASIQEAINSLSIPDAIPSFLQKKVFFDHYRAEFGKIKPTQVGPIEYLLDRLVMEPLRIEEMAYVLATVKHETNDTYLPVREAYWLSEAWRKVNLTYWPWYGRGFVQLTHEYNYEKAGDKLGLDLTTDPDAAMQLDAAYHILVRGMVEGWFRPPHRLSKYITDNRTDYLGARAIVNGRVKGVDERIAAEATKMERCLVAAAAESSQPDLAAATP